jgi:hypothetical protein
MLKNSTNFGYHRTLESYLSALLGNSFSIVGMQEWSPNSSQLAEHPEWKLEIERPIFLILAADAS